MIDTLVLGLRVVLSLGIVLAVLWFCARQLRGRTEATRRVPVTVLGRQSLGRHTGVTVVEVAGRTLVLGVSDAGVRLLTEVGPADQDEAAEAAEVSDDDAERVAPALRLARSLPEETAPASFADILAQQDPAPRHRAPRREAAAMTGTGPLAGSILDRSSWTRTLAVLQDRGRR